MENLSYEEAEAIQRNEAVLLLAEPLLHFLNDVEGLTELVVNEPEYVLFETNKGWEKRAAPQLTLDVLNTLATAIATYSSQDISKKHPILSAILPGDERIQIVTEPAVTPGTISLTIRRPAKAVRTMAQYVENGTFNDLAKNQNQKTNQNIGKTPEEISDFFKRAIDDHLNIAIVGDTGSGKTTFMKTLCAMLPPHERIITIEDVREIFMDAHPNKVHLLYSKGNQGTAKISPADLIASCMRMKPDRVLLAELRGSESYDFLKLLTTGHSGSITSYHAANCASAIARFVLMAKEHPEAAAYQDVALKRLFFTAIDIVAHLKAVPVFNANNERIGTKRVMTEIYYDPKKKEEMAYEA